MMRQFFLSGCLLLMATAHSQDLKTAQGFYDSKNFDKAYTAIDAAVKGTAGSKPEAWVWKHKICWAIANDKQLRSRFPDAMKEGFEALKKTFQTPNGEEAMLKILGLDYYKPLNDYYTSFINEGSVQLNTQNHVAAFSNFKNALSVSSFFYEKKLINTDLDTTLVFYAGYAAMKADKKEDAVYYFSRLADNSCRGTDLQIAYGWLCDYYLSVKKDAVKAKEINNKGLRNYPSDEYLLSKQAEIARQSGNTGDLYKVFEERISSGRADFNDYLSYAAELYDELFVDNTKDNRDIKEKKMAEVLTKALELNKSSAEANYIMGMYCTSKSIQLNGEIKNITDAGKKSAVKKEMDDYAVKSTAHLETAAAVYEGIASRKTSQTAHYKTALQQLVNLYNYLLKPEKAAVIKQKLGKL